MKNQKWLYKIGDYSYGIIISFIMLLIFGGIGIYIYKSTPQALIFSLLLTAFPLFALIMGIVRSLTVKFYVNEKGFLYQTNPSNGKFYRYTDIKSAWVSTGSSSNGFQSQFFNFETSDGETIRVPLRGSDAEATDYVIDRVESTPFYGETNELQEKTKTYEINGKTMGKGYIVIALFIILVGALMQVQSFLFRGATPLNLVFGIVFLVSAVCVIVWFVLRYKFFKVRIEANGFYFQTTPFNGKFYRYSEIKRCKAVKRVYRSRSAGAGNHSHTETKYAYFFVFTDRSGNTKQFQFEKEMYEREIDVLRERIQAANNPDYSPYSYENTATQIEKKTYRHPYSERYENQNETESEYGNEKREEGYEYNVPLRSSQTNVGAVINIVFSLVFVCFAIYFASLAYQGYQKQLPNPDWADGKAQVITVLPYIGPTEEDRKNETYVYDITYQYEVDGKTYDGYVEGSYTQLDGGSTCDIKYNPENPEESVIKTEPNKSSLYISFGAAALFAAFALWRIIYSIKLIIKNRKNNAQ